MKEIKLIEIGSGDIKFTEYVAQDNFLSRMRSLRETYKPDIYEIKVCAQGESKQMEFIKSEEGQELNNKITERMKTEPSRRGYMD